MWPARSILCLAILVVGCSSNALAERANSSDDDDENGSRIEIVDGRTSVFVDRSEHQRLGILTAAVTGERIAQALEISGEVLATERFVDLHAKHLKHSARLAGLTAPITTQKELIKHFSELRNKGIAVDRAQMLHAQRGLQDLVGRYEDTQLQLRQIRDAALYGWGQRLGYAVGNKDDPLVTDIFTRRRHLIVVALPSTIDTPVAELEFLLDPSGNRALATPLDLVGPAVAAYGARGRSYFLSADRADLRSDMQVRVWVDDGDNAGDVATVPRQALVWLAGNEWLYVEQKAGWFERRQVSVLRRVRERVFVGEGVAIGDMVVVKGAPSLLGEEFRASIPDEDDD